jgi:hypothetical protein
MQIAKQETERNNYNINYIPKNTQTQEYNQQRLGLLKYYIFDKLLKP